MDVCVLTMCNPLAHREAVPTHRLQSGKLRLQAWRRGFANLDKVFGSRNDPLQPSGTT